MAISRVNYNLEINEASHDISKGESMLRFSVLHLKKGLDSKRYRFAALSDKIFDKSVTQEGIFGKILRFFKIRRWVLIEVEGGYVKVNGSSVQKRLNLTDEEFKKHLNRQRNGLDFSDEIEKLIESSEAPQPKPTVVKPEPAVVIPSPEPEDVVPPHIEPEPEPEVIRPKPRPAPQPEPEPEVIRPKPRPAPQPEPEPKPEPTPIRPPIRPRPIVETHRIALGSPKAYHAPHVKGPPPGILTPAQSGKVGYLHHVKTDARTLFHIGAHTFGKGSELEGASSSLILGFWKTYLPNVITTCAEAFKQKYTYLLKMTEQGKQLADAASFDQFTNIFKDRIKANEPFLMSGGWVGNPAGHEIYYQIIPEKNGTYTFRLYNLGAGSGAQGSWGHKTLPSMDWAGIQADKLKDPLTLKSLYELTHIKEVNKKSTSYTDADIYGGLKSLLQPTAEIALDSTPMSAQEIGICPWKSLCPFIREILDDRVEYKHLMSSVKVMSSHDSVMSSPQKINEQEFNLFRKSIRSAANYLTKHKDMLSQEFFKAASKHLSEARQHLRNMKPSTMQQANACNYVEPSAEVGAPSFVAAAQADKVTFASQYVPQMQQVRNLKGQPLPDQFNKLEQIVTGTTGLASHQCLLEYMQSLPLDLDLKVDKYQALQMLSNTQRICRHYYQNWSQVGIRSEERKYLLLKLHIWQTQLNKIAFDVDNGEFFKVLEITYKGIGSIEDLLKNVDSSNPTIRKELHEIRERQKKVQFKQKTTIALSSSSVYFDKRSITTKPAFKVIENLGKYQDLKRKHPNAAESWLAANAIASYQNLPVELAQLETSLYLQKLTEFLPNNIQQPLSFQCKQMMSEDDCRADHSFTVDNPRKAISPLGECNDKRYEVQKEPSLITSEESLLEKAPTQDWPREEKYLFRLIFSADTLAFNEMIGYCREHPNAISSKEFQKIFIGFLLNFAPDQFTETFSVEAAKQFDNWLSTTLKKNLELKESSVAVNAFLIRGLTYLREMTENKESLTPFLKTLLKRSEKPAEKQITHLQILATLSKNKRLTDEEVILLSQSALYLQTYPPGKIDMDRLLLVEGEQGKITHADQILNTIKSRKGMLSEILHDVHPQANVNDWEGPNAQGQFTSKTLNATFNPVTGDYQVPEAPGALKPLPMQLLINPHFVELFPTVTQGREHRTAQGTFFEFEDKAEPHRTTRVHANGKIEQQFPGEGYYTYLPSENMKEFPKLNKSITEFNQHWKSGNKILHVNKKSHQVDFESTLQENRIVKVRDMKEHLILSKPSEYFTTLDVPEFVEQWHKEDQSLAKVSIPRLGLHFEVRDDPKILWCKEHPGYFINLAEHKPYPIRGFPRGLVIENSDKNYKYLLPRDQFKQSPQKESLLPPLAQEDVKSSEPNAIPYYTYNLVNNKLQSLSMEAELHLASAYFLAQHYNKAAAILKKYRTHIHSLADYPRLAETFRVILKMEQITGDNDPNAAMMRAFTGVILLHNQETDRKFKISDEELGQIQQSYKRALKKSHHVHVLQLNREEELALIQTFKQPLSAIVQARLNFLTGEIVTPIREEFSKSHISVSQEMPTEQDLSSKIPSEAIPEINITNLLVTRPQFDDHFYHMYNAAKSSNRKEKEWLQAAIAFAKHHPDQKQFANLLELVLKHPNEFESLDVMRYNKDEKAKRILATAEKLKVQVPAPTVLAKPAFLWKPAFNALPAIEHPIHDFTFNMASSPPSLAQKVTPQFDTKFNKLDLRPYEDILKDTPADPVEKRLHEAFISDVDGYRKKDANPAYAFKGIDAIENPQAKMAAIRKAIPAMSEACQADPAAKAKIDALEKKILSLANTLKESPLAEQYQLMKVGGQLPELNLNQILAFFSVNQPEKIQEANPTLTQADLRELFTDISEYLLLSSSEKQKARGKSKIDDLNKATDLNEMEVLIQELGEIVLAKRVYDLTDKRANTYLVLEHFADILMREKQFTDFNDFLSSGKPDLVKEIIMGAGKTSVLLVLLGLLRADGQRLSMQVIVPAFLKDVATQERDVTQTAFGKVLKTLHFDRATPITKESMQNILNRLREIIVRKEMLIIDSHSMQCLTLREKELWFQFAESDQTQIPEELELFKEIMLIIRNAYRIDDEKDISANVLHTTSFSTGKMISFDHKTIKSMALLNRLLYNDEDLKKIAQIETDPHKNPNADPLTVERYHRDLKRPLAEKFVKALKKSTFAPDEAKLIPDPVPDAIIDYLASDTSWPKEKIAAAEAAYKELPYSLQRIFRPVSLSISSVLPHTLTEPCGIKYGIGNESPQAIPFTAANSPNEGSEFSNPQVTFHNTIQAHFKDGVALKWITQAFDNLVQRISSTVDVKEQQGLDALAQKWRDHLGITSLQAPDNNWTEIIKKINGSADLKMEFIEDFISSAQEFASQRITATPYDLDNMNTHVTGFSGSLWNSSLMSHPDSVDKEKGTDTRTLALLAIKCKEPALVLDDDPDKMLTQIGPVDMICDAGGYFKEYSSLAAARMIANKFKKPVVFFHNKVKTVTNGEVETPFIAATDKPKERITFIEQVFATGADIKQHATAVGQITIKKGMLTRDLAQAVWRLRGIERGQTPKFALTREVDALIRDVVPNCPKQIGYKEIYKYCRHNTAIRLSKDGPVGLAGQIGAVCKKLMSDTLLSDVSTAQKKEVVKKLKPYWVTETDIRGDSKLSVEVPSLEAVRNDVKEAKDFLIKEFAEGPELTQALQALSDIQTRFSKPGMLADKLIKPLMAEGDTTESEKETETDTEKRAEVQQEDRKVQPKAGYRHFWPEIVKSVQRIEATEQLDLTSIHKLLPVWQLNDYFHIHPDYKDKGIDQAFHNIDISPNLCAWTSETYDPPKQLSRFPLYDRPPKHINYMLVGQYDLKLLSHQDAGKIGRIPGLRDQLFSMKTNQFLGDTSKELTMFQKSILVKAKFLAGISQYNKEEQEYLISWLKSSNKKELKAFFEDTILKAYDHRQKEYQQPNDLKKIFKSLGL